MGLEAGSYIKDLVPTNPQGTDPKSQGDDHLRLIKTVLATQFSGFTEGIPITVSESEINSREAVSAPGNSPFSFRNKLINGEVTRINQRNIAGWSSVATGDYGYDRWKKTGTSTMTQIIEAGNFKPSTVHTLSGNGITTQQITSPASGNWTLPNISTSATYLQLEEGTIATPFEIRHIALEVDMCQRYYQYHNSVLMNGYGTASSKIRTDFAYPTAMRAIPTVSFSGNTGTNASGIALNQAAVSHVRIEVTVTAQGMAEAATNITLTAEL
jgi:hypothetical protein